MATYQAPPPGATGEDPGRTMGIVGLILAIFCNLIGLSSASSPTTARRPPATRTTSPWPASSSERSCFVIGVIVNFTVLPGMMRARG